MIGHLTAELCNALAIFSSAAAAAGATVGSTVATDLPVGVWHWAGFAGLVVVLLLLDLVVFHRTDHKPSLTESTLFTLFWIAVGLAFNAVIWWWGYSLGMGHAPGVNFLSGYLVEKSLSMDNIFVFVVIFQFFAIPMKYQYRVLFWGILGAVFMRLIFILVGVELFNYFEWVALVFGMFLIYTAYKLARHGSGEEVDPEKNTVLIIARKLFRVTKDDHHVHGHDFFAKENGVWCVTPMFMVLLVIESTDVIFAIDSVPAIIAITSDRFIVFTSNIFAILGLRALYFLLAGVVDRFKYLHYGLAAVLGFVGVKMIVEWSNKNQGGHGHVISPWQSLAVIAGLLVVSVVASLVLTSKEELPEHDFGDDDNGDDEEGNGEHEDEQHNEHEA